MTQGKKRSLRMAAAAAALATFAAGAANAQAELQPAAAKTMVARAAEALGGADKLRAVRNISMWGEGQFAWVVGAEVISASPHAPRKYVAMNDLTRVYDLEHDRFQLRERRNFLFMFLAASSFSWPLYDQRLDGDVAWDAQATSPFAPPSDGPPKPVRVANAGGAFMPDGVHMRRMKMMTNPVVLVRAMMDPATQLSQPRVENGYQVVDVRLKQGDRLSVGFQIQSDSCQALCKDLPGFIRYTIPTPDLGQDTETTWLTGYGSFDGLMLPMGFDTHLGFQDIDYERMTADRYEINGKIADLAAPADVRNAPVPPDDPARPVTVEKVADHIWRFAPNGTTAIEFQDHITLFEMDAGNAQAKLVIEAARKLVPGKPVTQLIASHEHFDHVSGLREAVSEGLAVIAKRADKEQFEEMVNHPAPDFPDDLARNPKPLHFIPVDEKLTLSDSTMTLDILWARNNPHMADAVVAYAPKQKVIMEGDVATASLVWQFWPDSLRDIIDYYHLDVAIDSPVHEIDPKHPGAISMKDVDELIKGGVDRARKLCADEVAKNNYLPSCPVYSKRY